MLPGALDHGGTDILELALQIGIPIPLQRVVIKDEQEPGGGVRSNRMPRIPKFPTNQRAVCRILTAYVANDINALMR